MTIDTNGEPTRRRVTASGTTTIEDPHGSLVSFEDWEERERYTAEQWKRAQDEIDLQAREIERLTKELAVMIEPLEIPDTARADFWAAWLLAVCEQVVPNDKILTEADRMLAEYDKRFTDPPVTVECEVCGKDDPRYVDLLFDGPPSGSGTPGFMDATDQNGNGVSLGEWLEVSPGDWVLRITLTALRKCLL